MNRGGALDWLFVVVSTGAAVAYGAGPPLTRYEYVEPQMGTRFRIVLYAADEAMERVQKPIWRSKDLQLGMSSFRKNGPGLARFEGC